MKLLIVEDEEKIANSLKRGFEDEDFVVDVAYDGEEGLTKATNTEYDAIILDIMLPRISGLIVLKKLRERKIFTPIIMLTARDTVEDKIQGLESGSDDYLAKPFSFEELLARVKALIRRSTSGEQVLTVDNLELNPYLHIVKRKGKVIDLSKREFRLLEYLMKHKSGILSESQILSHVWEDETSVSSNVVAAYMKNIRKKIDKFFPEEKPLLKTIRGLGYKIDDR